MPHESRMLMEPNESLLSICLELHMSNTGSSDCLRDMDRMRLLNILLTAVQHWEPSTLSRAASFDDCVRTLCLTTIRETKDTIATEIASQCRDPATIRPQSGQKSVQNVRKTSTFTTNPAISGQEP